MTSLWRHCVGWDDLLVFKTIQDVFIKLRDRINNEKPIRLVAGMDETDHELGDLTVQPDQFYNRRLNRCF